MQITEIQGGSSGKMVISMEVSSQEGDSFLSSEEKLADLLNEVGRQATAHLLKEQDESAKIIYNDGVVYYSKGIKKKTMKAPTVGSI